MNKQLLLVFNGRGDVGKSLFAISFVQYLDLEWFHREAIGLRLPTNGIGHKLSADSPQLRGAVRVNRKFDCGSPVAASRYSSP